jgi:hypothetical protein
MQPTKTTTKEAAMNNADYIILTTPSGGECAVMPERIFRMDTTTEQSLNENNLFADRDCTRLTILDPETSKREDVTYIYVRQMPIEIIEANKSKMRPMIVLEEIYKGECAIRLEDICGIVQKPRKNKDGSFDRQVTQIRVMGSSKLYQSIDYLLVEEMPSEITQKIGRAQDEWNRRKTQ